MIVYFSKRAGGYCVLTPARDIDCRDCYLCPIQKCGYSGQSEKTRLYRVEVTEKEFSEIVAPSGVHITKIIR